MKEQIIREQTTEELKDSLIDQMDQLRRMKMSHSVSQLENPLAIKKSKKTIARIKTELRRRELDADNKSVQDVQDNKNPQKDKA